MYSAYFFLFFGLHRHSFIFYFIFLVGPALEAFGFQRIIYGSSPSPLSHASSHAGDWYELARESFAELGVEQEGIDAVFFGNAQRAFSRGSS